MSVCIYNAKGRPCHAPIYSISSHTHRHTHKHTNRQFPLWSLVTFGAYALSNIGLNLITFNNCPTAALELTQDIQEAKTEMRKRGLNMDY